MKKKRLIIGIVVLALIVCLVGGYFIFVAPGDVDSFSVSDFTEQIENPNFHTDKRYGTITDARSAERIGKKALTERFGDLDDGYWYTWERTGVAYDAEQDVWYVCTEPMSILPFHGGVHKVLLGSDGTVVAIWGEK